MWWEPVKFGATQVQCGKYRISKPDSEGTRPQLGHAGVMESVSRDKSANTTLAHGGSERLACGRGGVQAPPTRRAGGAIRFVSVILVFQLNGLRCHSGARAQRGEPGIHNP